MYYLQSRYYNPEWGRFINADATGGKVGELLSHNVFAYCMNNPVNMSDPDGHWPKWVAASAIVVAIVVVTVVAIITFQEELLVADVPLTAALDETLATVEDVAPKVAPKVVQAAQKITSGSQVTEQVVREAVKDAPLKTQQSGVSLPAIQRYVDRLIAGDIPPAIKVDQSIVINGNHRYIASRIMGMDILQEPGAGARVNDAMDFIKIFIDPVDWGNR